MFYDRFRQLCERKGISCNKAALEIGLSNATPTKWKKTGATPVGDTLDKIAAYFGVTTDYLLGKETITAPANTGKRRDVLDEVDIAFYGDFKDLDEDDKETVRDMVRVMRERRARKQGK